MNVFGGEANLNDFTLIDLGYYEDHTLGVYCERCKDDFEIDYGKTLEEVAAELEAHRCVRFKKNSSQLFDEWNLKFGYGKIEFSGI